MKFRLLHMINLKPKGKWLIFSLLSLLFTQSVYAGIEPAHSAFLSGDFFIDYLNSPTYTTQAGFTNDLIDFNSTTTPYVFPSTQHVRKIENMLQLYLDPDFITFIDFDYQLEVKIQLKKFELNASNSTTEDVTLIINYDPMERSKWVEKANYHFVNCGRVNYMILSVKLTSSKTLNDIQKKAVSTVVGLRSDIIIERYFDFDVFTPLFSSQLYPSYNLSKNELTITWDQLPGAEYYDLEWTYVDDYNGLGGKISGSNLLFDQHFNLARNSTRVQLATTEFTMPVVFESGYILYRVRGIGMEYDKTLDIVYRMPGTWSTDISPTVNAWPNKYQITTAYELDKLNWQIITSYAEEGKHKSIIGFMDGTQRNRQTVTGLSTEEQAMVAEQIYDHQGRPAIEVLPVPTNDPILKYYKLFNTNANGAAYNRNNFDITKYLAGLSCDLSADPMNTSSGASRYYSPQNPVKTDQNAYIPDAEGYPFVQTERTPDNTGRITRQSGVGIKHKLGSGHETKYFYGTPVQEEISTLFGTQVGFADHYKKNVVQDPNGQLSVSFMNLKGNVIATALAGNPPKNLDSLDSYKPYSMNVDLMVFNQIDSMANEIVASKSFTVTTASDYNFSYTISNSAFSTEVCDILKLCFDCVYDLEITVIDNYNCNTVKYNESKQINPIKFDANTGYVINDACPKSNTYFKVDSSYASNRFKIWLDVGSYTVTKKLKVNQAATDAYVNHYMELFKDTCDVYDDLLQFYLDQVDSTMCDINDSTKILNRCEIAREAMLSDLSPGGQYGQIDWPSYSSSDPLSVYNESNILPELNANWRNPLTHYRNEDNTIAKIQNSIGAMVYPEDNTISLQEFLDHWESSWAVSLLHYHPEYCYYEWCHADSSSFDFDIELDTVLTYTDAVNKGVFSLSNNAEIILTMDPYFKAGAGGLSQAQPWSSSITAGTLMQDALHSDFYNGANIAPYNMLRLAVWSALAKYHYNNYLPTIGDADTWILNQGTSLPVIKDSVWMNFRSMYLAKKEELQYKDRWYYAAYQCGNNGGYNECIDTNYFNWHKNGYGVGSVISGTGPFFNLASKQACYWSTYQLYSEKGIRFPSMYNLPINFDPYGPPQDVHNNLEDWAGEITSSMCDTCHCRSKNFGGFINAIIHDLENIPLNQILPLPASPAITELKQKLALCNMTITDFRVKLNGPMMSIDLVANGSTYGTIELTLGGVSPPLWYRIDSLRCVEYNDSLNRATGTVMADKIGASAAQSYPVSIFFNFINGMICQLWNDCPGGKNICPPTAEAKYLSQLINTLIAKDSLHRTIKVNKYISSGLAGYFNPIPSISSNIIWSGQVSNNILTATVNSNQKQCSFILEFPAGANLATLLPTLGPVLSLTPDQSQIDPNSGYSYHAVMDISIQVSTATVKIKVKSNCFPLSYCDKCPPENNVMTKTRQLNVQGQNKKSKGRTPDPIQPGPIADIGLTSSSAHDPNAPCYPCDTLGFTISYDSFVNDSQSVMIYKKPPPDFCDPCSWPKDTLPTIPMSNPCIDEQILAAYANANNAYQHYLDSLEEDVRNAYIRHCMKAKETFTERYMDALHHFTLYFYDQAGNLIETIPPEGVVRLDKTNTNQAIAYMKYKTGSAIVTQHEMPSKYVYNSLNQLRRQAIPDHDGESIFFYDYLSRIVVSQNPEQRLYNRYSYSLYDKLNRPYETGELNKVYSPMTDIIAKNQTQLLAWIAQYAKQEVTSTQYDRPLANGNPVFNGKDGQYRDRIASVTYKELDGSPIENSTYYLYDIHGNVNELVQDVYELGPKRMSYDYDLISGNVKDVYYQRGEVDQFIHRYEYDADNRIRSVWTSFDGKVWDNDAQYYYYPHGPLASMELGEHKVQGVDFAYTIQGWIKGVNSGSLNHIVDIGQNGVKGHPHETVAQDAFGYILRYFTDDYKMIGSAPAGLNWEPKYKNTPVHRSTRDLYNGNIQSMITAIGNPVNSNMTMQPLLYGYGYDQLNRITGMQAFGGMNTKSNNWVSAKAMQDYASTFSYDANGNIDTLTRNGTPAGGSSLDMDHFIYHYKPVGGKKSNQLGYVDDDPSFSGNYPDDIDDQSPGNYAYDAIGNLIGDLSEKLTIGWNVSGKVRYIRKNATSEMLNFHYDPTGKRVIKSLTNTVTNKVESTYYVLDATGNVMAIYSKEETPPLSTVGFTWESAFVYGSSRIGEEHIDTNLIALSTIQNVQNNTWYSYRNRGSKYFELGNHLGNVLATVSDRKLTIDNDGNKLADEFRADIWTENDYYPFGSSMPERTFSDGNCRFGFNGKENDNEVKGKGNYQDYGMRAYDGRLGRFFSVDPITKNYPELTPYQFASNTPINSIDLDGLEQMNVYHWYNSAGELYGTTFELKTEKGLKEGIQMWENRYSESPLSNSAMYQEDFKSTKGAFIPTTEHYEYRNNIFTRAFIRLNKFMRSLGKEDRSMEGRDGMLKAADMLDKVAKYFKKVPVIGTAVAEGYEGVGEIIRIAYDLSGYDTKKGMKKAGTRIAAFFIGKAGGKTIDKLFENKELPEMNKKVVEQEFDKVVEKGKEEVLESIDKKP